MKVTTDHRKDDDHREVSLDLPGGWASITLSTHHGGMKPGTVVVYVETSDVAAAHSSRRDGSSSLALYGWEAVAQDAGVSSEGSGFRGVSLRSIVPSREAVGEVMGTAVAAGGGIAKRAEDGRIKGPLTEQPWGSAMGYLEERCGKNGVVSVEQA